MKTLKDFKAYIKAVVLLGEADVINFLKNSNGNIVLNSAHIVEQANSKRWLTKWQKH